MNASCVACAHRASEKQDADRVLRRFWAALGWQRGGSSRARVLEGGWAWARPYSRVPELAAPPKEFSICRVGRLGGRETLTRLCGARHSRGCAAPCRSISVRPSAPSSRSWRLEGANDRPAGKAYTRAAPSDGHWRPPRAIAGGRVGRTSARLAARFPPSCEPLQPLKGCRSWSGPRRRLAQIRWRQQRRLNQRSLHAGALPGRPDAWP